MSLYKTRPFSRLARKYGLSDEALKKAVAEMRRGIIHANLGGNVYKQRVALAGCGKSGASRVIIAANLQDRWIFIHCFLKKDQANISRDEEAAFKDFARIYLGLTENVIQDAVDRGVLEVLNEDEAQK